MFLLHFYFLSIDQANHAILLLNYSWSRIAAYRCSCKSTHNSTRKIAYCLCIAKRKLDCTSTLKKILMAKVALRFYFCKKLFSKVSLRFYFSKKLIAKVGLRFNALKIRLRKIRCVSMILKILALRFILVRKNVHLWISQY